MEELVVELHLFLELLDREYLSAIVREKKSLITNILHRIQATKEPLHKTELHSGLPAPPQMPLPEIPHQWLDNVDLPYVFSDANNKDYDSDAMSSSYESYDEEEEDGKGQKMRHQWPSEEASMDLVKDARICAFLLRKKRFGQWTKLLCVIKDNKLLCYKSSKDQNPQMELVLTGCSITHIPKDGKKKKHELKITHQGADALVLAVQSKEQAEEWLKVIKDVCSNCNGAVDSDGASSSSPVHKTELEKKLSCDRPSSDGEWILENGVADVKEQGLLLPIPWGYNLDYNHNCGSDQNEGYYITNSPVCMRRTLDNSPASSCDTSDTETSSLPVNSAAILKKQSSQKASPNRGHVLRKAKGCNNLTREQSGLIAASQGPDPQLQARWVRIPPGPLRLVEQVAMRRQLPRLAAQDLDHCREPGCPGPNQGYQEHPSLFLSDFLQAQQ
ncbi:UNVERIFIED_CONTAM: hypothetical protein FKN15_059411 [Acipenser sinensis]